MRIKSVATSTAPEALIFLADEHALLRRLLGDFERDMPHEPEPCAARLEEVRTELQIHARLEEELFYPALLESLAGNTRGLRALGDAAVAHATIAGLIERLELIAPAEPGYRDTFGNLAQAVRRHLDEEERVLFPLIRRSRCELDRLGARMAARRVALAVELGASSPGDTEEAEEAGEGASKVARAAARA
jgi:iron-sulfur cluster repair protein YtfE (RIC family)